MLRGPRSRRASHQSWLASNAHPARRPHRARRPSIVVPAARLPAVLNRPRELLPAHGQRLRHAISRAPRRRHQLRRLRRLRAGAGPLLHTHPGRARQYRCRAHAMRRRHGLQPAAALRRGPSDARRHRRRRRPRPLRHPVRGGAGRARGRGHQPNVREEGRRAGHGRDRLRGHRRGPALARHPPRVAGPHRLHRVGPAHAAQRLPRAARARRHLRAGGLARGRFAELLAVRVHH